MSGERGVSTACSSSRTLDEFFSIRKSRLGMSFDIPSAVPPAVSYLEVRLVRLRRTMATLHAEALLLLRFQPVLGIFRTLACDAVVTTT